jgi:hypothetical protein
MRYYGRYYGTAFWFGALIGMVLFLIVDSRRRRQAYTGPVPPILPSYQTHWPDADRTDFLARLSDASFSLTAWEEQFLETNIGRICFTPRQRVVIDGLRAKYGQQLWLKA